ncbi:MAG: FAD-dependent oxidoreductase [Planctomycetes bacterium]|nr:FAD-dependent oxidoreductase [Planctomycetota bacterium]
MTVGCSANRSRNSGTKSHFSSGAAGAVERRISVVALVLSTALAGGSGVGKSATAVEDAFDVVVVGATAGGVAAAIQVRRMGRSVVLIEPGAHVGGLTSGGLGATDIGNKSAIGGLSREFYRRVRAYYQRPEAWKFERQDQYRSGRASEAAREDAMWTFEPHVAEAILREMLAEAQVVVRLNCLLNRPQAVEMERQRIVGVRTGGGETIRGRVFVDATYEGDLLAAASVRYHVGRESNATYGETLNGVQTRQALKHQLQPGVDAYRRPGDPASGLLPGVHANGPGDEGAGDHRVQAYCFRMCVTDVDENRIPFEKPADYDELRYELLFRNFEAGETKVPWSPFLMPNRKTDTNNNFGFSTDNILGSYDWPEGDDARREAVFREHLSYQRGLMWTLANHPRVPRHVRDEVSRWGNCRDEFREHGGWSHQLYVREARRMIGALVMTQHHCQGRELAPESVGLAAYGMDSHNVQRYVDSNGHARNEGDVQVHGFTPYPIGRAAIVPRESECENLLVPVCVSASHIAYGSIRMEPVFMVLGQSAGTIACQTLDDGASVQRVDYARLEARLRGDGQILAWIKTEAK